MEPPLKILILEDNHDDVDLIQATLKRAGLHFTSHIVAARKDFRDALDSFAPSLILSDHNLPQFSSTEALHICRQKLPYIPFILVTGTVSDELATLIIKEGADDYILKNNLKRLPTAIRQAIEKKQTEKSQALLVSIVNSSDDAILSMNLDGIITSWNTGAQRIFGYQAAEVTGENVSMLIPGDRLNEEPEIITKIMQGEFIEHYETQRKTKDGNLIHISLTVSPIKDTQGNIIGASKIARDITGQREAEQQKEFDQNNLRSLINNTKDLMWSVDKDLKVITFNDSFNDIVTLISGKTLTKGDDILSIQFTEDQSTRYKAFYQRALSGEAFTIIDHFDHPVKVWSEISFYPIRQDNAVIGTACFSHDITERKLAELERVKLTNNLIQRNKDLEQFSYIVSHNLRAPVANIIGALSRLDSPGLSAIKREILTQGLRESVVMLDDVIKDLNLILQVKHTNNEMQEKARFSKLVTDIKVSIKDLIDSTHVRIEYDFSEIDEFLTIKSYLYSIFYNLISNSIKYRQQAHPSVIKIKSQLTKNALTLVFTDNGLGIDLRKRGDQVFGLYKRFHPGTEGKGIGLYMVKTQVETLGGKITVQSEVNKGTEFRIEFEM